MMVSGAVAVTISRYAAAGALKGAAEENRAGRPKTTKVAPVVTATGQSVLDVPAQPHATG